MRSGSGCPRTVGPGDICFHSRAGAELGGAVLQAECATPGTFPAVLPALAEDTAENQAPPTEAYLSSLFNLGPEGAKAYPTSQSSIWNQGHLPAYVPWPTRLLGAQESVLNSLKIRGNKKNIFQVGLYLSFYQCSHNRSSLIFFFFS